MTVRILHGDCRALLPTLPDGSVHCCVTSPPYFGLRDYGHAEQIGLEPTPDEFVAVLVDVFREVRRVLRDDGTLWLNLGDSYCGAGYSNHTLERNGAAQRENGGKQAHGTTRLQGLKSKDLIGIPWRVAFALQSDGWYLRQDIIWHKPNPMPESMRDRCTKAHEYVFLLSKSPTYYCDMEAIAEPAIGPAGGNVKPARSFEHDPVKHRTKAGLVAAQTRAREAGGYETRNKRSVWTIVTQPYSEAHFATMAPELAENCIKAGCPIGGTVLDPFGGAGTTGLVADRLQRSAILIELNATYADMARTRVTDDAPLFAEVAP